MSEKVKKPIFKRWWFWVLAVIIILGGIGSLVEETPEKADDDQEVNAEKDTKEEPKAEKKEKEKPKKEENPKTKAIEAGTYKVGSDIDPGEYLVFADSMGYIENAKDSKGQVESIIFNANLTSGSHHYVTLNDGNYFKMQGAEMYPVDKAPNVKPDDGVYKDGMYKVGKDIDPGEYKVTLESGMGYYEVAKNSAGGVNNIITNENVQADTYITIEDGQYIKLQGVTLTK
ncbi:hypothetical protein [Virgibacillus dokdonensis]|uniref:hypothetical protein n=1 Tax=Virgibacillus dokdonensis TaxID=302167 RepID=UPI00098B83D4|nr:hypothetical protein [Virgibacillus dokdonensis]